MIRTLALALLVAAAVPLPQTAADAAPGRAASRDWSGAVTMTVQGGMRMGNPAAPVKLVEYGSLACPHCRHFEETGYGPLVSRYVRSGRVSFEFRNMMLNGADMAVSLLARCGGPASFFPRAAYIYSTQPQWEQRIQDMSDADAAMLDAMNDQQRVIRYAELGGMIGMAAKMGMTPAQAKACLANGRELTRLVEMTQAGNDAGVHATPTFLINGKTTGASSWEELEPLIRRAGG